ncbi:hypothetical protein [Polyangium sp. y55x31]|uniref:hypothetical protein n=1 Tax=Polyangium sp. y55x31 TaxID=3042688 RepID=UPI002482CDC4|nr:hypothetical protein [Polyangium sp. y55x31]MDI1483615.1 hypothetical protein [Polyangium sp. y55x31]
MKGSLTDPFFVDMDASCRFVGFGFARDWDARRRQFVQSLLLTHEFVLPATDETRRWSASASMPPTPSAVYGRLPTMSASAGTAAEHQDSMVVRTTNIG